MLSVCVRCKCLGEALAEPPREQPYQAPVSKCFLASAIVLGFGICRWDGSLVGKSLDGLSFSLCSIFVSVFYLDRNIFWVKNFVLGSPVPQLGAVPIY